jgi:glycosyltransferase involved in cell wall biosynthesis
LGADREIEENSLRSDRTPLILWNQRWEYDKNPDDFFKALDVLAARDVPFQLALCGQQFGKQPAAFADWLKRLDNRIRHVGYAPPDVYARLLWQSDVTVSTAQHEFFGISILEAIYARTFPILPDRLSYPEIVPDEFHRSCLYDDFDALVGRLGDALADIIGTRAKAALLAPFAAKYQWQNLAPEYDARLTAIAGSVS